MPGISRSLPDQPNLRHLNLEAKRRVAAGEFPSPHEAQAATWTARKQQALSAEPAAAAALTVRLRARRPQVVLTSRMIPVNSLIGRLPRNLS